ncbi:hypothetical protein [Spiribacter onubensis]|uniref:DUF2306 domain-containing protein n=1 Tax=Spiribacter onubensis TaxID=3122420 RepID=A0ABV3S9V1_9GAMM
MGHRIEHLPFVERRLWYLAVTAGLGLLIGLWIMFGTAADRSEIAWIQAEWKAAMGHLRISLTRLIEALALAVAVTAPLSLAVRRLPRLEATITPLMLTALAVPWVLLSAALNMMIHLRLDGGQMVLFAAMGGGAWILGALAPRQQSISARCRRMRYGMRTIVLMLIVAEMLALTQGLGSQIRFYTLYWSPTLLFLYGGLSVAVIAGALVVGRFGGGGLVRGMERLAAPRD